MLIGVLQQEKLVRKDVSHIGKMERARESEKDMGETWESAEATSKQAPATTISERLNLQK